MIIHTYATEGFMPWAALFVKSYKHHNGDGDEVIVTYKNDFDYDRMCKVSGLPLHTLLRYKHEVETQHVTDENKVWKLMIAGDDRIREIQKLVHSQPYGTHILHFDVDMYFRGNIDELKEQVRNHDICIRLRPDSKLNRKTMIGVQGYTVNYTTISFLDSWVKYIEDVPPAERPLGYGQTSCWYAYLNTVKNKPDLKWHSVDRKFISPRMNQDDIIWSANTKAGKTKNLNKCKEDFNEHFSVR